MAQQKKYYLPEVIKKTDVIEKAATPEIRKNMEPWLKKALVSISQDRQLYDYCTTEQGAMTVAAELAKAASSGLQIGGLYEQAYVALINGKPGVIVKDSGMLFISTYGSGAVLKHPPQIIEVREADKFQFSDGEITHDFSPFADRGKIVGYYAKLEYKTGVSEYEFCSIQQVERIKQKMNLASRSAWKNWSDEMAKKTAAKQILKKATKMSDGLANMYESFVDDEPGYTEQADISERAASRLDDIIDVTPEYIPETEPEQEPEIEDNEAVI